MHEVDKNVLPTNGTILRAVIPTGDITAFYKVVKHSELFKSGAIQVETKTTGGMSEVTLHSSLLLGFLADHAVDEGVLSRWRECFSNNKKGAKK